MICILTLPSNEAIKTAFRIDLTRTFEATSAWQVYYTGKEWGWGVMALEDIPGQWRGGGESERDWEKNRRGPH